VTEVRDDRNANLHFDQEPGKLTVHLGEPYGYGEQLSFTVFYRADNVAVDPKKYGMSEGYDLGLSFKPATEDHPRLINSLSFPAGARHWFPCYDHPKDKATGEVIATVNARYQVVSNGRLVSVTEDRKMNEKTFHWSQELPHSTYLFVLVAGPYVKVTDSLGTLPLGYWVYPSDVDNASRSFRQTPEIIEFFNNEFGYPYPWARYDQITIPGIGGGAESTTATVVGQNIIHDEKADKDFPSHGLVAHEAAHQWWGDLVTMRDWSHAWLNEGFATYGEYLYARHSLGEDEGALNLLEKKNRYLVEARTRYKRPIVFDRWEYPNQLFDRHSYQKGAAVLVMLRRIMGDRDFRRAISSFLHKHEFQPVDTHDLVIAIRESTGQVLDWFFDQWLYQAGHPVFEIRYAWLAEAKKIRLTVVQTQETSVRIPVFQVPVAIGITTATGKRSENVWIRQREETFELDCAEKPLMVRFDEGNYLLKEWTFPKSTEELLYQLAHDDSIGRMWAALELSGQTHRSDVMAALRLSARKDAVWAVRRNAIQAIAAAPGADVGFLQLRSEDEHPEVRSAAMRALGDRKDGSLARFFEERFRQEDSYKVQAEALRALGKCGDRSSLPLLREAAAMRSPRNIIRNAAEWALGTIQK
jgi:aminopeptidase N